MTHQLLPDHDRLMRIETLLEAKTLHDKAWQVATDDKLSQLATDAATFKKEYDSMVNRGAGIMISVGAAASLFGAVFWVKLHSAIDWFMGVSK